LEFEFEFELEDLDFGAKEREEDGDDSYIVFVRDRLKENSNKFKKLVLQSIVIVYLNFLCQVRSLKKVKWILAI
jgi:hypothetical protein